VSNKKLKQIRENILVSHEGLEQED